MTIIEGVLLVVAVALAIALAHVLLRVSLGSKMDAAIDRVVALMQVHHASVVDKITALPPPPVATVPTITVPTIVTPPPAFPPPTTDVLAATSRDPQVLADCLNHGGPNAIRLAFINLMATDDTQEYRLGLLFDGIYGPKFAAAGFYGMLSDTMQGVVRMRLEGISNTENLRAMLGCNPTLRYDGNGNYTAL